MNILMMYPSWEERSILGFERDIVESNVDKLILFENDKPINSDSIDTVLSGLEKKCIEKNINYEKILLEVGKASVWGILKSLVASFNNNDRIKLDICTMSRNLIWALLFFLKEKVKSVDIVYHQPNCYPGEWLCRDAMLPRLLYKHSGIVSIGKKTLLVIITGFDVERTKQLVNFYNPGKVVLLIQKPNRLDNNKRNTSVLHSEECKKLGVKTNTEIIDCYKEDWGYEVIEKIVADNLNNYNIIVSSLGPKLSAVSVYKVFLNHPEIALSYIPCKEYNVDYCKGIGDSLNCSLVFNNRSA